jgi:ribosome maturation factor RimP
MPRATRLLLMKNDTIEQTVIGLGYDLVDIERTAGGMLRVTIDMPYLAPVGDAAGQARDAAPVERFVNAEDCEKVTRQLQFVLEVEGVEYARLEVSSPGIDRPLRTPQDFERFAGEQVDLTLKAAVGAVVAAGTGISANQKKFRGTLERPEGAGKESGAWQIVWSDEAPVKPGVRVSKKRPPAPVHALGFTLDEVHTARLAPMVDFKGRKPRATRSAQAAQAGEAGNESVGNLSERLVK